MTIRVLVVDDEPLAVERMQILCSQIEGVDLVGTAGDGEAALRMVEALKPELLLLDISMPELDGMGVARRLQKLDDRPDVIFCTAFDKYAVEAFDVSAIGYLMKPVAREALERALGRARERREVTTSTPEAPVSPWTREFWVPHRSEMLRIDAGQIDKIVAERDYMRLHVGERSYLLHETISSLEERLDPGAFIRVHRSIILRRDFITGLHHQGLGVWCAKLADGEEARIGRSYLPKVKAIMKG